jgi:beta-glucanase (GH16 family)
MPVVTNRVEQTYRGGANPAVRPQYFNDTQEIDMEFLSSQYNDTSRPVNLVLQSPESLKNGFDAANTGTFDVKQLSFFPDDGFHEYRFDWSPESVAFYADGTLLQRMDRAVPSSAGHITFSHWSNGDPKWSGGPPEEDAIVTIQYFKGYFNSSLDARQSDFTKRCQDPSAARATCPVPEMDQNPDAKSFFFVNEKNMATDQIVSDNTSPGSSLRPKGQWFLQGASAVVVILSFARVLDWCL